MQYTVGGLGQYQNTMVHRRQAIARTNADLLMIGSLYEQIMWFFTLNTIIVMQGNVFESIVWEIAAILFRPQCVKLFLHLSTRCFFPDGVRWGTATLNEAGADSQ